MALEFRPLHGEFGAEVIGIAPDLRVDEATLRAVEAAWFRHGILVFRDLDMTPDDHIAFTRRLGPLHIMVPGDFNLPDRPEVWVVGNDLLLVIPAPAGIQGPEGCSGCPWTPACAGGGGRNRGRMMKVLSLRAERSNLVPNARSRRDCRVAFGASQ